ncbi:MAG: ATP phosphoribosyltransferase regulatory subunit, partial [Pseudomonadota bacterium]
MSDLVPPMAAAEWTTVNQLIETYMGFGFALVKPPLMEFEGGLMAGPGVALAPQTFRLMDPVSSKMLGLRADITAQIARIAGSRLQSQPRPLRLAYAGEVVRVNGTDLRPERQFCQVGAELIGAIDARADAEVITMAVAALRQLNIEGLSVDLCLPTLQPHFMRGSGLAGAALADLAEAVGRRDREAVLAIESPVSGVLAALLDASGPAATALAALEAVDMPSGLKGDVQRLMSVVSLVQRDLPDLTITVDPLERQGFEYQTGLSFTLFAKNVRGELGRGGRYRSAGVMNGSADKVRRADGEAANQLA